MWKWIKLKKTNIFVNKYKMIIISKKTLEKNRVEVIVNKNRKK